MKRSLRWLSLAVAAMMLLSVTAVGVSALDDVENLNPYSAAAMQLDKDYAYDGELGAVYTPEKTSFSVWAPLATDVKLNLYATGSDSEEGAENLGTYDMDKGSGDAAGVWSITLDGDYQNVYYTYTIENPDHIYNASETVTHETQDIYSYAVGVNGDRSMVVDLDTTDPEGWDEDQHVYVGSQAEAIIWEVQVKDFSYNENSGVTPQHRGKYLAFTETGTTLNDEGVLSTGIDYLKQLGVTHVQINPFYDFATVDEDKNVTDDSEFNWGYDPKNYGVPEGSYSTNPYDGNVRIKEAKEMIKALHDAGIGVIMDVVYNHTYSVDSCFNYSVPEYYYRMTETGGYSQQSGCGNDTASERAMYRRYMRDMLAYWTDEYHIDGYRFDLMGVHDGETMNLIRDDMDAIDERIIMYGEGWSGNTVYDPLTCSGTETFMTVQGNASKVSSRIGFFNDQVRDGIKAGAFDSANAAGFVSGSIVYASNISYGVRANTFGRGSWAATSPEQCVTYASCHDNMTLYDKLVAINHGASANYRARYSECIEQNKLAAAIISSCQGIDFILAGEEMGRSKDGDENSYKSAATLNMIDWSLLETNADLVSYYKGMFELRKAFSPFTSAVSDADDDSYQYTFATSMTASGRTVAYTIDNTADGEWSKVAVIYNGGRTDAEFTFAADDTMDENTEWVIVANNKTAGVSALDTVTGLTFIVPASSAIIAVEKSSYDACAIQSSFKKVIINSVYDRTGEVLSSNTLLGKDGEGYVAGADTSIPINYELSSVDGDTAGVYDSDEKTVTYHYTDYVPTSLTAAYGDVNDDGDIDITDGTVIQRHLAHLETLDEEHESRGDYDYSGYTDINDVTLLQRYLAKFDISVYNVTTRYIGYRDGKSSVLAANNVTPYRLGSTYTTAPRTVSYYVLGDTPYNASGIVTGNITVTYVYNYEVTMTRIHVKHSGDLTWAPCLWAWSYTDNNPSGTAVNAYSGWPGLLMTNPDEDGWYTTDFPSPGGLDYYFIISQNGSPQTADYGPISYNDYPEIWVVINDDEVATSDGYWVSYYNYNPDTEN